MSKRRTPANFSRSEDVRTAMRKVQAYADEQRLMFEEVSKMHQRMLDSIAIERFLPTRTPDGLIYPPDTDVEELDQRALDATGGPQSDV